MAVKKSEGIPNSVLNNLMYGLPRKMVIDIDEFNKLLKDKKRTTVLNCDTLFDQTLQDLCGLHFSRQNKEVEKLFEPTIGGPLVSLTHKATLAYALGIIDKTTLNDLRLIHKIRNEFAHGLKMDFASTTVLKHTQKLSTADCKVTVKNSYEIFRCAVQKCSKYFRAVLRQETYRMIAKEKERKRIKPKSPEAKTPK